MAIFSHLFKKPHFSIYKPTFTLTYLSKRKIREKIVNFTEHMCRGLIKYILIHFFFFFILIFLPNFRKKNVEKCAVDPQRRETDYSMMNSICVTLSCHPQNFSYWVLTTHPYFIQLARYVLLSAAHCGAVIFSLSWSVLGM